MWDFTVLTSFGCLDRDICYLRRLSSASLSRLLLPSYKLANWRTRIIIHYYYTWIRKILNTVRVWFLYCFIFWIPLKTMAIIDETPRPNDAPFFFDFYFWPDIQTSRREISVSVIYELFNIAAEAFYTRISPVFFLCFFSGMSTCTGCSQYERWILVK